MPLSLSRLQYVDLTQGISPEASARLFDGLRPAQSTLLNAGGQNMLNPFWKRLNTIERVFLFIFGVIATIAALIAIFQFLYPPNTPRIARVETVGIVILRQAPSPDSLRILELAPQTVLIPLGLNADSPWFQVRTANGSVGWIERSTSIKIENFDEIPIITPTFTPQNAFTPDATSVAIASSPTTSPGGTHRPGSGLSGRAGPAQRTGERAGTPTSGGRRRRWRTQSRGSPAPPLRPSRRRQSTA